MTLAGTGGMEKVTGGSYPARIFTAYMKGALADLPISKFAPLPKGQPNGAKSTASPTPSPTPTPSIVATVILPDLLGVTIEDATVVLQELGLLVVVEETEPDADPELQRYVVEQSPVNSTVVQVGSTVTLKVATSLP
jgi:hypothetical protein